MARLCHPARNRTQQACDSSELRQVSVLVPYKPPCVACRLPLFHHHDHNLAKNKDLDLGHASTDLISLRNHLMSNYISSFLIEPVVRQARRFSRTHEDSDPAPAPSIPHLQHVPDEDETIHVGGRLAASTANGVRAVQDVLSASAWPQIISGLPVVLSPSSEDGGLEAELAALRSREQRASSLSHSRRQSAHHSLTDILRGNSLGVDEDTSGNPLYGIPDRFRSTTTSFSSLSSLNDATVTPTEGHARSRANTARGSYSSRMGDGSLPADDGMGLMRRRIKDIQELNASNADKARLIHGLMTEQYSSSQPSLHAPPLHRANSPASLLSQDRPFTPSSDNSMNDSGLFASPHTSLSSVTDADNPYNLTPDDLIPTYMPKPGPPVPDTAAEKAQFGPSDSEEEETSPSLGCKHYKRNVKLQCSACNRWYTCRFCHDEAEDHSLKRRETKNMLCMLCGCAQPAGEECGNCGERTARYFCNVCKLWDDASEKSIYHCNDCGICRVGQGLGKDFYHCKVTVHAETLTMRSWAYANDKTDLLRLYVNFNSRHPPLHRTIHRLRLSHLWRIHVHLPPNRRLYALRP